MRELTSSLGGAMKLLLSLLLVSCVQSSAKPKVENSFNSQYSHFKDYSGTTPSYSYPDLTVKSGSAEISNSPIHSQQDPLLSQGTAQQPVAQAPNQHVYYYETYPMQDTSRGSAYGVPGSNKRCTYMGNGNVRCVSRQDAYGVSSNDYDTSGGDESSGAGLGGLAGLIGLLGLKGLKGLASVIFPIIFPILFPLILPLLLPILLPLLLLLLLPILLLPIPVITVPTGRSFQDFQAEARKLSLGVIERIMASDDECIEKISCEIVSRMSRNRKAGDWVEKAMNFLPESSPITKKIFKGINMVNSTESLESEGKSEQQLVCSRLKCKMLSVFGAQKTWKPK